MMKKIIAFTSKSSKTKHVHYISNTFPDQKSYASLILLNHHFHKHDRDFVSIKNGFLERIKFSREFLAKEYKRLGMLSCKYCGKQNLIIENEGMKIPLRLKATIDHVIPVSKGGARYDLKNIVISCGRCNNTKADMDLETFLMRTKK